ncbi:MAG: hypothetical protein ACO1SV_19835 [Fimbriimonas sp.]
MTLALLAAAFTVTPPVVAPASDYFPLVPGTRTTYEEKTLESVVTTDVVEAPVEIAGVMTTPVTTYQYGKRVNTAYYRVDADSVSIIAYDKANPLPTPLPILKMPGEAKMVWDFSGPGSSEKMAEPLAMKGESEFLKTEREVFGKKVPVLQVRMTAVVGGGKAKEEIEQVAIYGKGIGLIETTSTTKINKRKAVSVLRLTKIEPPKEAG